MSAWTVEYDNSDTSSHEWWTVADGDNSFQIRVLDKDKADKLAAALNALPVIVEADNAGALECIVDPETPNERGKILSALDVIRDFVEVGTR